MSEEQGYLLVSAMGCQQASTVAPTVVVEHPNDVQDRDRERQQQSGARGCPVMGVAGYDVGDAEL